MARMLLIVENPISLKGRGTILWPGFLPEGDERFPIGSPVSLHRPDRSQLQTEIVGIDYFNPGPRGEFVILVGVAKSDVPIGTEVWSI